MAQIKNIKKPGEQIRGADVGFAGLDKNGNMVGTGITEDDLFKLPEGAQTGDVLAWGGETGAEWRPHYPDGGNEGDVLTKGETGPEWTTPQSGGGKYLHYIFLNTMTFLLVSDRSSAYTASDLKAYLDSLVTDSITINIPVVGYCIYSSRPGEHFPITRARYGVFFGSKKFNLTYSLSSLVDGNVKYTEQDKEYSISNSDTCTDFVIAL